ncbi:MAG: CIA30 family protein [Planctomycetota bacterium]
MLDQKLTTYMFFLLLTFEGRLFAQAEGRMLLDFDDRNAGREWITVNDNVMGGRSSGGPKFDGKSLIFSGTTVTDGGGFSSIRTNQRDWDLGEAEGILIRYRADGRTYQADILPRKMGRGMSIAYRAKFKTERSDEWTTVRLPFSAFKPTFFGEVIRGRNAKPLDRAQIGTIGFIIYDKLAGDFRLEVDWIKAYGPGGAANEAESTGPVVESPEAYRVMGYLAGRFGCRAPSSGSGEGKSNGWVMASTGMLTTLGSKPGMRGGLDIQRDPTLKVVSYGLSELAGCGYAMIFAPDVAEKERKRLQEALRGAGKSVDILKLVRDGQAESNLARAVVLARWTEVDRKRPHLVVDVVRQIERGEVSSLDALRRYVKNKSGVDLTAKIGTKSALELLETWSRGSAAR